MELSNEEKLAEEYEENAECIEIDDYGHKVYDSIDIKDAFLAGLKVKTQWHDLRENPNDLPKDRHSVWIVYLNGYYQKEETVASYRHKYWVISGHKTECEVIAWCEIPKWEV